MSLVPKGYKDSKIGIIPNDWEEYLFNDIFVFCTGKNIKQNEASIKFETPCVRYGELYHMYDDVITTVINKTNLNKSELVFSKGDEILLPSAGEDPMDIGSASALTIENVAIGRTINILRPLKEDMYSQIYVAYYINHKLKRHIAALAKGSSISNVYNSDLKKLKIPLPKLKEQEGIAEILTTWDHAIKKQEELIKEKELLKKSLMQKLLSGVVRFDDFDDAWEEKKLKEIGEILTGTTPSTKNTNYYNGEILWVTPTDITDKKNILSTNKLLTKEGLQKGRVVPKNSLLVTCIASIGKNTILREEGSCNQQINSITPNEDNNIDFLYYLIDYRTEYIKSYAGQGTMLILNKHDFSNILFTFPKLKEQERIAEILTTADKEIDLLDEELKELKKQKKGLMQKLLTGKLRVKV